MVVDVLFKLSIFNLLKVDNEFKLLKMVVDVLFKLVIDKVELLDKLFKLVVNAYTDSVDILDEIVVVVSCVESS
jgi:hypothetical protein